MKNKPLEDMIAVVTGAAQGLGLGIARTLADDGAHIVLADRQIDKAEAEAARLRSEGLAAEAALVDISDSASVDRLYEQVHAAHKRIDIAVNNAGVGQNVCAISGLTDDEWRRVIDITLTGAFYCCRAVGRIMEEAETGVIINIASINGQNPAPLVAAYNVAKAGVISLTRTLALEMAAYGVRVNAVCPGPVYTDFNKTVMAQRCESLNIEESAMIERIRTAIPLGRWGEATDIARAVSFLCSRDASWITGEIMRVSGGPEGVAAAPPKRASPPRPSATAP